MSAIPGQQFIRDVGLIVANRGGQGIDLSQMHFSFEIHQDDEQSPNNALIRVWNLHPQTQQTIIGRGTQGSGGEYSYVALQVGYVNGTPKQIIFDGVIKQFRTGKEGKEGATDTYLDIMASDGDLGYNWGFISQVITAGQGVNAQIQYILNSMAAAHVTGADPPPIYEDGYFTNFGTTGNAIRSKVLWGMARDEMRKLVRSNGASWSIQNGKVQIIPNNGFIGVVNDAVVLNSMTGMIGIPEQTDNGIRIRSLLRPELQIGRLVKINNSDIIKTLQSGASNSVVPFNQRTGILQLGAISSVQDGLYRLYVIEHSGDTRGQQWYSDMICLAVSTTPFGVNDQAPG